MKDILAEAGELLKEAYHSGPDVAEKERYHLVTDADRHIEQLLCAHIAQAYPDAVIVGEEGGASGSGTVRWFVDPIDGTANLVCGVPHAAVSLAREEHGCIVEAWVYNPITDELYHGLAGSAATLNGVPITPSTTTAVREALVGFGFSARFEAIQRYHDEWTSLFDTCRKGLGLLAPALNICAVARGRLDCFVDFGSSPTGHSGAALIAACAGASVRNYDGTDWDHTSKGIVVTNGALDLPRGYSA